MDAIRQVFMEVDRADFLPEEVKDLAALDVPLPIGHGQTNSQPWTVQQMLVWLDARPGEKVLDIGSGSGWTTALLAALTKPGGQVFAVERIPELLAMGRANCKKAGVTAVKFFLATTEYGLSKYGPYDRILVSAAARQLPQELLDQLKSGGKLVIPVRSTIWEITKSAADRCRTTKHPGFAFVPLL